MFRQLVNKNLTSSGGQPFRGKLSGVAGPSSSSTLLHCCVPLASMPVYQVREASSSSSSSRFAPKKKSTRRKKNGAASDTTATAAVDLDTMMITPKHHHEKNLVDSGTISSSGAVGTEGGVGLIDRANILPSEGGGSKQDATTSEGRNSGVFDLGEDGEANDASTLFAGTSSISDSALKGLLKNKSREDVENDPVVQQQLKILAARLRTRNAMQDYFTRNPTASSTKKKLSRAPVFSTILVANDNPVPSSSPTAALLNGGLEAGSNGGGALGGIDAEKLGKSVMEENPELYLRMERQRVKEDNASRLNRLARQGASESEITEFKERAVIEAQAAKLKAIQDMFMSKKLTETPGSVVPDGSGGGDENLTLGFDPMAPQTPVQFAQQQKARAVEAMEGTWEGKLRDHEENRIAHQHKMDTMTYLSALSASPNNQQNVDLDPENLEISGVVDDGGLGGRTGATAVGSNGGGTGGSGYFTSPEFLTTARGGVATLGNGGVGCGDQAPSAVAGESKKNPLLSLETGGGEVDGVEADGNGSIAPPPNFDTEVEKTEEVASQIGEDEGDDDDEDDDVAGGSEYNPHLDGGGDDSDLEGDDVDDILGKDDFDEL